MRRRSQLTLRHERPASSERQTEPCACDAIPFTPSEPVWISAYIRLPSDGAIATSVLPYGGRGSPGCSIRLNERPPLREMYMPLPIPPLCSTCVCSSISHVSASTMFGSCCDICSPEQPVFSFTNSTCCQVRPPLSVR